MRRFTRVAALPNLPLRRMNRPRTSGLSSCQHNVGASALPYSLIFLVNDLSTVHQRIFARLCRGHHALRLNKIAYLSCQHTAQHLIRHVITTSKLHITRLPLINANLPKLRIDATRPPQQQLSFYQLAIILRQNPVQFVLIFAGYGSTPN